MKTRILIEYQAETVRKPVLSQAIKTHDVELNILKANINSQMNGRIFAEIEGSSLEISRFMDFLSQQGVLSDIRQSLLSLKPQLCFLCQSCIQVCPTSALSIKADTDQLSHDPYKCVSCDRCITICPNQAIIEI